MWFAVSVIVAVMLALGLGALVSPLKVGVLNVTVPLLGPLVGGAIAGGSLRVGRRATVGFAVAFLVSLPILMLRLIGIQGMGEEELLDLLVLFIATGAVAFGLMGLVGVAITGLGVRAIVASLVVFGLAGSLGGALLAILEGVQQPGAPTTNLILTLLGSVVFLVLPAALGGAWLARRLSRERERQARETIANRIATLD